jgi:ABC-type antimicrobial peptide transport system permease subunit
MAPSWLGSPAIRAVIARLGRYLGALTLIGVGVDHIQQYSVDSYSAIPTIGTLCALNFASATVVGMGLVAPVRRLAGRWADAVLAVLAVSGIGIAAGSLAGLLISESSGLFGFMEQGYRAAIVTSIVLEVVTVFLLGAFLAANGLGLRLQDKQIRPG